MLPWEYVRGGRLPVKVVDLDGTTAIAELPRELSLRRHHDGFEIDHVTLDPEGLSIGQMLTIGLSDGEWVDEDAIPIDRNKPVVEVPETIYRSHLARLLKLASKDAKELANLRDEVKQQIHVAQALDEHLAVREKEISRREERIQEQLRQFHELKSKLDSPPLKPLVEMLQAEVDETSPIDTNAPLPGDILERVRSELAAAGISDHVANISDGRSRRLVAEVLIACLIARHTGQILVLGGPPGTGKSTIAGSVGRALARDGNCEVVPVRPSWLDAGDLFGFLDPRNARFHSTPFLDYVLGARATPFRLIVLDEMNLARIENYGADLLSQLASTHAPGAEGVIRLYAKSEIEAGIPNLKSDGTTVEIDQQALVASIELQRRFPPEVSIPESITLVGTLNNDETTYSLSPKVLDRCLGIVVPRQLPVSLSEGEYIRPVRPVLNTDEGVSLSSEIAPNVRKDLDEVWENLVALSERISESEYSKGRKLFEELSLQISRRTGEALIAAARILSSVHESQRTDWPSLADVAALKVLPSLELVVSQHIDLAKELAKVSKDLGLVLMHDELNRLISGAADKTGRLPARWLQ